MIPCGDFTHHMCNTFYNPGAEIGVRGELPFDLPFILLLHLTCFLGNAGQLD